MKQVIVIIILFLSSVTAFAQERKDVTQEIKSLKGFATINIDSQVTPEGKIKKQKITNDHSAFNININRNTYKFYCDCIQQDEK